MRIGRHSGGSWLRVAAGVYLSALGAWSCGADASSGPAAPSSAGSSTAGASNAAAGSGGGGATSTAAGASSGGSAVGGATSGSGGSNNAGGAPAGAHGCPVAANDATDIETCGNYDPVANGIPGDPAGLRVASFSLAAPTKMAEPFAISQNVRSGSGTVEYWGADTSCGPALQKLGARTAATGIGCIDTLPTASFPYVLSVIRMDMSASVSDERFCSNTSCPK